MVKNSLTDIQNQQHRFCILLINPFGRDMSVRVHEWVSNHDSNISCMLTQGMETFTHHAFQRAAESQFKSLIARAFQAAIWGLPGVHIHKLSVPHLLHSNTMPMEVEASLIKCVIMDAHLLYTTQIGEP